MKKKSLTKVIAGFIIVLFVLMSVISSTAVRVEKEQSLLFDGNTLYVGGSGPNNYTAIQDAVDDAVNGDTVFVYNDSSPYYENIIINKSIGLIGEDKNTTIIDGSNLPYNGIGIGNTEHVVVSGFTIKDSSGIGMSSYYSTVSGNIITPSEGDNFAGISISGEENKIENNVISNFEYGIYLVENSGGNCILNNTITYNYYGIYSEISNNNYIIGNFISDNMDGIELFYCNDINIIHNIIENNSDDGISIIGGENIFISKNLVTSNFLGISFSFDNKNNNVSDNFISNNELGIKLFGSNSFSYLQVYHNDIIGNWKGAELSTDGNTVSCNNFINNIKQGSFIGAINNEWDGNYWNRPRIFPFIIKGRIGIIFNLIPWFNIDYNPASEPYEI